MPDTSFTQLTSARLVLRRFVPADTDIFVAYRSDPEVARYQGWEAPYPHQAGQQMIGGLQASHPDTPGEWFQFALTLRSTGELIGDLGCGIDGPDDRQAEIGFTLRPGFTGHGYATEGAVLLLGYLFTERGKHRVRAECDARNTASAAVLDRIGMRREGWRRESTWAKGEWTDDLLYAMLDREWAKRSST
ncbi:MAG TPA: GNAT family protein [Streptosporangiaceae bacterium]